MNDDEEISFEREEPSTPDPVSLNGVRYEALQWGKARGLGQNGGFIVAIDEKSGAEKWVLKVYDVTYDPDLESDVQDVFITTLELETENLLHVVNELDEHYLVNIETQTVRHWVD